MARLPGNSFREASPPKRGEAPSEPPGYDHLHAYLLSLDTSMEDMLQAHAAAEFYLTKLDQINRSPTSWIKAIESAIGNDKQLSELARQHNEMLITYESLVLNYHLSVKRILDVRAKLEDSIKAAVKLNANTDPALWRLKPIIRSKVLKAAELHSKEIPTDNSVTCSLTEALNDQETLSALREAFSQLAETAKHYPSDKRDRLSFIFAPHRAYPKEHASPKVASNGKTTEQREVWSVVLWGALPISLLANYELTRLMPMLETVWIRVKAAHESYLSSSDLVKEEQYARRLVQELKDQAHTGAADCEMLAAQNRKRLDYNSTREMLYAELASAEHFVCEAVQLLKRAIDETIKLGEPINNPPAAIDRKHQEDLILAHRLAMLTCLAADVELRLCCRVLCEAASDYQKDVTNGRAAAVAQAAYEKLEQHYQQ